ncbi:hypothetical protein ACHAXR_012044 [Thalassiosira sp. AJA248-18]
MDRDENGKRVVTTVTTTTTVDNDGNRRTETVTKERHLDDGGRVETTKLVQDDGDKKESSGNTRGGATNANSSSPTNHASNQHHPLSPPRQSPFHNPPVSPAMAIKAASSEPPTTPTEVAVIATDCLLGVSVSDSITGDPDSALPSTAASKKKSKADNTNNKNNSNNNSVGWRKTEYLFRLGRFIPPFMIVNKYYQDKEEEERRRKEMQKEYNDMRDRLKKNRWDSLGERNKDDNGGGGAKNPAAAVDDDEKDDKTSNTDKINTNNTTTPETPISNNLSNASSRTEYYLQRIYVQMNKNINMMHHILFNEITKPDFPKKVQHGGSKIIDNMGPTMERTGKLMGDVWDMWMGSVDAWYGGGNGGGKGR